MNLELRLFLALSAVLHGRDLLEAFDGSLDIGSNALGIPAEEVQELSTNLQKIPEKEIKVSPMVSLLLKFYNMQNYCFLGLEGKSPVSLAGLMEQDRNNEVSDRTRRVFLGQLLVHQEDQLIDDTAYIEDGVMHSAPHTDAEYADAEAAAYALLRDGIRGISPTKNKQLAMFTDIKSYTRITAKQCVALLRTFVDNGIYPPGLLGVLLTVPDYIETYKATGCVMCEVVGMPGTYLMKLGVHGKETTRTCVLRSSDIEKHVKDNLHELALLEFDSKATANADAVRKFEV